MCSELRLRVGVSGWFVMISVRTGTICARSAGLEAGVPRAPVRLVIPNPVRLSPTRWVGFRGSVLVAAVELGDEVSIASDRSGRCSLDSYCGAATANSGLRGRC